ncbi:MAG: hypothetical protein HKN23_19015 [Verrucomicrobiales bacterium]|nr:hypothetical protein [Verrucomicrobiales bacterium]
MISISQQGRPKLSLLLGFVFAALFLLPESSRAGGMDPNHNWSLNVGNYWVSVTEYKGYPRATAPPFVRMQVSGPWNGNKRLIGRDFRCRFETFWASTAMIPVTMVAGIAAFVRFRGWRKLQKLGREPMEVG